MENIFKVTSFFDNARWNSEINYNMINFYNNDLSFENKLLTHWISYITDRQTGFKRIWDVGGFVFSELVDNIVNSKSIEYLNPEYENTHIIKRDDYPFKKEFKLIKENKDYSKYIFISHQTTDSNEKLKNYDFEPDMNPYFISRFFPSDYLSILKTFLILQKFDYNILNYIKHILVLTNNKEPIKNLLFGLYLLTYKDIGRINHEKINFSMNIKDLKNNIEKNAENIDSVFILLDNKDKFKNEFEKFCNKEIYKQKRAWCAFRDFIKFPAYRKEFLIRLKEFSLNLSDKDLTELELPGDVWNNNSKFRKCILNGTKYSNDNKDLNVLLRQIYKKENINIGYPEQFDITFDFVPRMCTNDNCSVCIYGKILNNGNGDEFDKICIKNENYYCTVALSSCNYKMMCKGEKCELLEILS